MQQIKVKIHVPFISNSIRDLLRMAYETLQNNGIRSDFTASIEDNRENIYDVGSIQPVAVINTRSYTEVTCMLYVIQNFFGHDILRLTKENCYEILSSEIVPIFGEDSFIAELKVVGGDFAMGERDIQCWFDDRTFTYNVIDTNGYVRRYRTHEEAMQVVSNLHWGANSYDEFYDDWGESQTTQSNKKEIMEGLMETLSSYNDTKAPDAQGTLLNRTIERKTGRSRTIFIVKEE